MGCGVSKKEKFSFSNINYREEQDEQNKITAIEGKQDADVDVDVDVFQQYDSDFRQDIKTYDFKILINSKHKLPNNLKQNQSSGIQNVQANSLTKRNRNLRLNLEDKVPSKSILKSTPSSGNRSGSSQNRKVEFSDQLFKASYQDWILINKDSSSNL